MKIWTPDYANIGTTNLVQDSWTINAQDNGFIVVSVQGYGTAGDIELYIIINNKNIWHLRGSAVGTGAGVKVIDVDKTIQCSAGDVIQFSYKNIGGYNYKTAYFVPGKWA